MRVTCFLMQAVLLSLIPLHLAAWGNNPITTEFDGSVKSSFISSAKKSYAMRKAKKAGKPLMVLLTKKGCGACQNLKQSVNMESEKVGITGQVISACVLYG